MFNVQLVGLPGAGKKRLGKLQAPFDCCLTVIDVRAPLPQTPAGEQAARYLQQAVAHSQGIVFQFMHQADLTAQSVWQKWCATYAPKVPIFRVFNQTMPRDWQAKLLPPIEGASLPQLALQRFDYKVPKLVLEHLLFGLDAAKQNLGCALFRVKGQLQTLEYENWVAIEGTLQRWDNYAAQPQPNQQTGWLQIYGQDLDAALLNEIVQAAYAPGAY